MNKYYEIIEIKNFRHTEKVDFYTLPFFKEATAVDLVVHEPYANSPGKAQDIERPWYCHRHQVDNLLVIKGNRIVDLYYPEYGSIETFNVGHDSISKLALDNYGKIIREDIVSKGLAIFKWKEGVYHRVRSGEEGSISINLAIHLPELDMETNFNIYDLNIDTSEPTLLREGFKDQH
jgi:hypothetical protein